MMTGPKFAIEEREAELRKQRLARKKQQSAPQSTKIGMQGKGGDSIFQSLKKHKSQ